LVAQPLTVTEITAYIQDLIAADELLADLWIEGEVVESVTSRSGHVFFTLAGDDSKLSSVMFRGAAMRSGYVPVAGQSCAAHGNVSIYAREGRYQLYVDFVRPGGIGLAALEFELLKQRLAAEGLFELSRKRPLPDRARTIGVVTSAEGAVWHDIVTVVARRDPFAHLILSPAAVQGESAAASLKDALEQLILARSPDVIIIGRGGGSASDLASFNDESLIRAVFASPIPVVSAVGHETDWTLLDLVSDVRAATPSAAAELCTADAREMLALNSLALERSKPGFMREIGDHMLFVNSLRDDLSRVGPSAFIPGQQSRLQALCGELRAAIVEREAARKATLAQAQVALIDRTRRRVDAFHHWHSINATILGVLNPGATLARGYATITDADNGMPISSVSEVRSGQHLTANLRDGRILSVVETIEQGHK
jgi:exodeoxyribonuclease VII large subunit